MKTMLPLATAGVIACMVSSVSASKIVVVPEVIGPAQHIAPQNGTEGTLQVYTARKQADVDVNKMEFLWNNDFGKNEFIYEPAHTDYTIYGADGKVIQKVRNASGKRVEVPSTVSLAPGSYTIQAEAELPGVITKTVQISVVIEPGEATLVNLQPSWVRPVAPAISGNVVRFADGRVIGVRATKALGLTSR